MLIDETREIEEKARQWVSDWDGIKSASPDVLNYFNGRKDAGLEILEILGRRK